MKDVSVIIRNHNNKKTVLRTLKSVFSQSLSLLRYEIIFVDDGSTDNSLQYIGRSFLEKMHVVQTGGIGAVEALNAGIRLAKGVWYTILDADDILPPSALETMLNEAKKHKGAAVIYGDYLEYIENSPFSCYWNVEKNIYHTLAGGLLIKKSIAMQYKLYDEGLCFPEYDLLKNISLKHKMYYLPEPVYYYFRHGESLTSKKGFVKKGIEQLRRKHKIVLPIRSYDWK